MRTRRVWRVEMRPATVTNDHRSVEVGMRGKSAQPAFKRGLTRSVLLIGMSALRTLTRGVPWINQDHGNAGESRLVGDERSKLTKRPRVKFRPLRARSPYPRTNVPEFFQRDRALCAFSICNDAFRNAVVYIAGESSLATAKALQASSRAPRALRLKLAPQSAATIPHSAQLRAGVACAVGIGRDIRDAEINTDSICGGCGWCLDVCRNEKEEIALAAQAQFCLPVAESEPRHVRLPANERRFEMAGGRRDSSRPAFKVDAEILRMEFNCPAAPKGHGARLPLLVRSAYLRRGAADDLSSKVRENFSGAEVNQPVNIKPSESLRYPCLDRNPVRAIVHIVQQREEGSARFGIRQELQSNRKLHGDRNVQPAKKILYDDQLLLVSK